MRKLAFTLGTLLLLSSSSWADPCSLSSNLISNCGFETGTLSSWTVSGSQSSPSFQGVTYGVDKADAYSGNYGAYLGGYGTAVSLGQSFATIPGTTYQVSYELALSPTVVSPYANSFATTFNGTTLYSSTNPQSFPYTSFNFTTTATSTTSTLLFSAQDDTGFYSLDNVSVIPAAVPEIDANSCAGALGLLTGALLIVRGRKPNGAEEV